MKTFYWPIVVTLFLAVSHGTTDAAIAKHKSKVAGSNTKHSRNSGTTLYEKSQSLGLGKNIGPNSKVKPGNIIIKPLKIGDKTIDKIGITDLDYKGGKSQVIVWSLDSWQLDCRREFIVEGDWSYYHFDDLGSTRVLTDGDGVVTDEYSYDAWGLVYHYPDSADQPYQYVGQLGYYAEGDFLQLGVRFYFPYIGRFTQRDAIREGLNLYAYSADNPIQYVDPSGMSERNPGWWLKKAAKCSSQAHEKCRGAKEWNKCYWTRFAQCMGGIGQKARVRTIFAIWISFLDGKPRGVTRGTIPATWRI